MDELREIIHTFEKEEQKDFKTFINRLKKKQQRKDLDLFELLLEKKEYKREEILQILYPEDKNLEAYHATRKRLIKQVTEFVYVKRIKEDSTSVSQILGLISLSNYLFEKKRTRTAWSYLKKAETIAINSRHFDILNNIYSYMLRNAESEYALNLNEIIRKKDTNLKKAIQEDNANTAYQVIKHQLNESLAQGTELNIDFMVKKVLMDYELTQASVENPKIIYNIIAITRQAFLSKKDFFTFEPYITTKYNELKDLFDKQNHLLKLNMLYWIAHTLYRNRKFKEAEKYLDELHNNLLAYKKSQYHQLIDKYYLLKAGVLCFSGNIDTAIELLETYLDEHPKLDKKQLLNTYLNLSVYYFWKQDYNKALNVFLRINHSDQWCSKKMGKEWVMKKLMIEVLGYYEMDNMDVADSRLRSLQRNFADLFDRKPYDRLKYYISIIKKIMDNPQVATETDFQNEIESKTRWLPVNEEDLQAMMFYAWVKSKMIKKPFFDVLLRLVNAHE